MNTYHDESRRAFQHTLGWLRQWACSRAFGLGTRMPWDPQYLIESLSDSTIYMAYYTVAHLLQGGDMYGKARPSVDPEQMTDDVWDAVFLGTELAADSAFPKDLVDEMRAEFNFWYPFDLRVSGKDLIQNHLTFSIYNHAGDLGARRNQVAPRVPHQRSPVAERREDVQVHRQLQDAQDGDRGVLRGRHAIRARRRG